MDGSMLIAALVLGATGGLFSSVHCAAMCGPLTVFAAGARHGTAWWLGGRASAYALAGASAGAFGAVVMELVSVRTAGIVFSVLLSVSLAVAGWRLVRPAPPRLVSIGRPRARFVGRAIERLGRHPFALGALTALLPCGALFAALGVAALSGSGAAGALAMAGFALASSLGLALAGWLGRARDALDATTRRAIGAVMLAGALAVAIRPLTTLENGAPPACHGPGVHSAP